MKAKNKHLKKVYMWYKVKELKSQGLKKVQIAKEVGIYRGTVSKYLKMNEEEFYAVDREGKEYAKETQPVL